MSDKIVPDQIISNFLGSNKKATSFKEVTSWRNLFEKSLMKAFDNQRIANNSDLKDFSSVKKKAGETAPPTLRVSGDSKQLQTWSGSEAQSNKPLAKKNLVGDKRPVAERIGAVALSAGTGVKNIDANIAVSRVGQGGRGSVVPQYSLRRQSLHHVHLTQSASGAELYVRNYTESTENLKRYVLALKEKLNHLGYAITVVKVNGKTFK